MRVPISILSLSLLVSFGLGSEIVFGAQLLTDNDLDQVTAAGTFRAEIVPAALAGFATPPVPVVNPNPPLNSAQASINAAAAAVQAAQAINGSRGLTVASEAVSAANSALENAFAARGISALNAGQTSLDTASAILKTVPQDKLTPEILNAAAQVQRASAAVEQVGLGVGKTPLNAAVAAVQSARKIINAIEGIEGADPHLGKVIQTASDSIAAAKEAITIASNAQQPQAAAPQQAGQPGVIPDPNASGNPTDTPIVRFAFDTGNTSGSGEAIPIATGPSQPALNLNSGGNGSLLAGNTFQVQNMILNINICSKCTAGRDLIQGNNGYVFPIYLR